MVTNTGIQGIDQALNQAEKDLLLQADSAKKLAMQRAESAKKQADAKAKKQAEKASKQAEKPDALVKQAETFQKQAQAILAENQDIPLTPYTDEYRAVLVKQAGLNQAKAKALQDKAAKALADSKQAEIKALAAKTLAEDLAKQAVSKASDAQDKAAKQAVDAEKLAKARIEQAEAKARKQADELAELETRVKAAQAAIDQVKGTSTAPEYDSQGNLIINTNLPDNLCQVLNLVADSAMLDSTGKALVYDVQLQKFSKKHQAGLETLTAQGYTLAIEDNGKATGFYSLTDKGLAVYNLTVAGAIQHLKNQADEPVQAAKPSQGKQAAKSSK